MTDGTGTPVATTGNLFDTSANGGLTIATIPADTNGTVDPTEIARVNYRCTVQLLRCRRCPVPRHPRTRSTTPRASSTTRPIPLQTIDPLFNYASNQSFPGANVHKARASLRTSRPSPRSSRHSSVAGTTLPVINSGETLTYLITVTLSEGTYQSFSLTDTQTAIPSPDHLRQRGLHLHRQRLRGRHDRHRGGDDRFDARDDHLHVQRATHASGTNTASVSATNAPQRDRKHLMDAGPPTPSVSKNFNPTTADAGDTVQIRLGWNNGNAANPMFQCVITDNVNTTFFDPATIAAVTTPAGYMFAADTTTGTVTYTANDFTVALPERSGRWRGLQRCAAGQPTPRAATVVQHRVARRQHAADAANRWRGGERGRRRPSSR